jgi:hypothetical protein
MAKLPCSKLWPCVPCLADASTTMFAWSGGGCRSMPSERAAVLLPESEGMLSLAVLILPNGDVYARRIGDLQTSRMVMLIHPCLDSHPLYLY